MQMIFLHLQKPGLLKYDSKMLNIQAYTGKMILNITMLSMFWCDVLKPAMLHNMCVFQVVS